MTKVLKQILNGQGVVIQVQEQDVPDTTVTIADTTIVAVQNAPTIDTTASNDAGPT